MPQGWSAPSRALECETPPPFGDQVARVRILPVRDHDAPVPSAFMVTMTVGSLVKPRIYRFRLVETATLGRVRPRGAFDARLAEDARSVRVDRWLASSLRP